MRINAMGYSHNHSKQVSVRICLNEQQQQTAHTRTHAHTQMHTHTHAHVGLKRDSSPAISIHTNLLTTGDETKAQQGEKKALSLSWSGKETEGIKGLSWRHTVQSTLMNWGSFRSGTNWNNLEHLPVGALRPLGAERKQVCPSEKQKNARFMFLLLRTPNYRCDRWVINYKTAL